MKYLGHIIFALIVLMIVSAFILSVGSFLSTCQPSKVVTGDNGLTISERQFVNDLCGGTDAQLISPQRSPTYTITGNGYDNRATAIYCMYPNQ